MSAGARCGPDGDLFEAGDFLASVVAGIDALLGEAAIFQRPISRFAESHHIRAAQPEVSSQRFAFAVALNLYCDAHDPTPSTAWIDNEVQATTVTMTSGAKVSDQILR